MTIYGKEKNNNPPGYYVYAYLRNKDSATAKAGTPYYIGKGKDKRAWDKHRCKIPDNDRIIILKCNLDQYEANDIEIRLIRWYGRVDLGTGILRNLTNGGDGSRQYKQTEESKKKIGAKQKGVPKPSKLKGTVRDQEIKDKISNTLKRRPSKVKGYNWWNNGLKHTKSVNCPGPEWICGRIKGRKNKIRRSISHIEEIKYTVLQNKIHERSLLNLLIL